MIASEVLQPAQRKPQLAFIENLPLDQAWPVLALPAGSFLRGYAPELLV